MRSLAHSLVGRGIAISLVALTLWPGCGPARTLAPTPGVPQYQQGALVAVPGGFVNAAGGNLILERVDLSIDTVLGTREIRAV